MRITNTTDMAKNTGVKAIGIGGVLILPGETKEVKDDIAYCTIDGKKAILPSIEAMVRTNQIRIEAEPAKQPTPEPEPALVEEPTPEPELAAEPEKSKKGRSKKAE